MAERKLEITKKLEDLYRVGKLDDVIAVLNLPSANYCEKRAEMVLVGGIMQPSCHGCVTQGIGSKGRLRVEKIKNFIDFFAKEHGTKFVTINGRGDPFHPRLKEDNIEKIRYARDKHGIQSYVFTAGNNLDEATCRFLADHEVNVLISLFGNKFIDADFFAGKEYPTSKKPLQNQAEIAKNLRRLIRTFKEHRLQPEEGTTRIGMNYVVSEWDLADGGAKAKALKHTANENGIFFLVNTNFRRHPDDQTQKRFEALAHKLSDFNLRHSTVVDGICMMGSGPSVTIDCDGTFLACPYVDNKDGDGKFQELTPEGIKDLLSRYREGRLYSCAIRTHEK